HSLSPCFFLYRPVPHLDLHSFPTRRSSDLFLGERILNVLFIRLPPRALGTDGDETDGRQIIPATFAALAACPFRIAAATRAEPKGQDAHAHQAIEPTKPLRRCHVYSSLRYFGH